MSHEALKAAHAAKPLQMNTGDNELGFEAMTSFFLQKVRQLTSKVRTLSACQSSWDQLEKKLGSRQRECMLRLVRCISPHFHCDTSFNESPPPLPLASGSPVATDSGTKAVGDKQKCMDEPMEEVLQVDFVQMFLGQSGGFLDNAIQAANQCAMQQMRISVADGPAAQKHSSSNRKAKVRKSVAKGNTSKRTLQPESHQERDLWWRKLDGLKACPLKTWYDKDQRRKLTMSGKNFASRVYHYVDRQLSRSMAKMAHKSALSFVNDLK